IPRRTVSVFDTDTEAFRKSAEAVRAQTRNNFATQPNRTQLLRLPLNARLLELLLEEGVVEMCVVRDKYLPFQSRTDVLRDVAEVRSAKNHLGRDPRKSRNIVGNISPWIYQRMKAIRYLDTVVVIDSNLCDAMVCCIPTRRLNINNRVHEI